MSEKKNNKAKLFIGLVAFILALTLVIVMFSPKNKKQSAGYVVGYLPYYSEQAADRIDYSALTHLNLAFANPNEDGTLSFAMSAERIEEIVSKCHKNGVKVILSLGGGSISSTNYNKIMRDNPEGIASFNTQILEFCGQYDLDGVDVDFEFIASSPAWEYFEDWMLALKKQCKKHGLLLTAAVASWYADNISDKAMDCFDYVMIMAYDNDADSENHSTYDYAEAQLHKYESRGISKNRMVLGVPFYGYRYTSSGAMNWNSAASYRYLVSQSKSARDKDSFDGVSYNGRETIRKKAELSKDYGGIMIWELSQDADGSDSLLKVIKKVYEN